MLNGRMVCKYVEKYQYAPNSNTLYKTVTTKQIHVEKKEVNNLAKNKVLRRITEISQHRKVLWNNYRSSW